MSNKQPEPGSTPATVHILHSRGATYELRLVCCNKVNCSKCYQDGRMRPTHGPYWYLCYTNKGKTARAYLGKDLDTARFRGPDGDISIALIRQRRKAGPPGPPPDPQISRQLNALDEAAAHAPPQTPSLRATFAHYLRAWKRTPKAEPE